MITNSPDQKKGTLLLNESPIEKSIISQSPFPNESIDVFEKIQLQNAEIQKLNTELTYFKRQSMFKEKSAIMGENTSNSKIRQLQNQISKLSFQNLEQKEIIQKLSEDLRETKRQSLYGDPDLMSECQKLQIENDRFREENIKKTKEIKELEFQLADLQLTNKRNEDIIEIQRQEISIKSREGSPESNRLKNLQMEYKISELTDEINEYIKEIDGLNQQIDKLKKENVIDRDSRNRRTFDNLKVAQGSRSRYSGISHSRVSDLQVLDNQRLSLKLTQKNKEYQMLYAKYQSLENQCNNLEEANHQLVRQQKMLSQRISNFQIHTEGDEVVGELQNKLVLMSTQMMRLGNLSRTKVQETKQLNIKIKELLMKNEQLEKDLIEKDKTLLNYKEELRLMELRMGDLAIEESRYKEDTNSKEKIAKLIKQIEKLNALYKEKLQILKNADIKNAILQQKIIRLTHQNEDLQRQNKHLNSNFDKTKGNTAKMMNQQAQITYYKDSNQSLKEEIKRMEIKVQQTRVEMERMVKEKQENRNINNNIMERLAVAQEELRRINIRYEEKQMEVKELVHQGEQKIISKNNEIKKLEEKFGYLERQNQRNSRIRTELPKFEELLKEIQRLEGSELSLKLQISNYQEKVALLAQENQRLTYVVDKKNQEQGQLKKLRIDNDQKDKKIRETQREIQTISNRERRYKEENDGLRQKLRENSTQERQVEALEFKNRQLWDEIEVFKTQLTLKQEQLKQIDERYQREYIEKSSLLRMNQELNSKISIPNISEKDSVSREQIQKQLKKYIDKAQKDALKIKELSDKNEQHEEIYSTFSAQIMRLNQVLGETTEKITGYKKQIDFLQHKVKTCQESLQSRKNIQFGSEKSIGDAENKSKIEIFQGKVRGYQHQIDLLKQRINGMKDIHTSQESKINDLTLEKSRLESKMSEMEYQISMKTENFRTVEDSFKLTILQIKNSNERLEQSLRQIQNHYISKLDSKENEVNSLRTEKRNYESRIYQLEKKISNLQISFGSELNEKNNYINSLNSNHNQTKEEIEMIKKIKNDYEIKVALLSQEIERLNSLRERQTNEIQALRINLKQNESKYIQSMKDSSYNSQTMDTLSQQIQRLNNVIVKNMEQIKQYQKKAKNLEYEVNELHKVNQEERNKKQMLDLRLTEEKDQFSERIMRYEQMNKQLKFQLQDKMRECEKISERTRNLEDRQQMETNNHMKSLFQEMKLLRESNQKLQNKLSVITREYENSVQQLEYYKKTKANADEDQKMRIIGNYESTIKSMKDENTKLFNDRSRLQNQGERIKQISYQTQERYKISEEKARTYEQKSKRLEQRLKVVQDRLRSQDDILRGKNTDKSAVQQKLMSVMEEVGRLKIIIKSKDDQIIKLNTEIKERESRQSNISNSKIEYYQERISDKKGIYVIKEVSEMEERSRSASGNNPQGQLRHQSNQPFTDLQHRYQLLESVNKKLSTELECCKKKNFQYQFKMTKLKEQFDLINRLIHEYREQNEKLKETNKLLLGQSRSNNLMATHSQFSSPQHSTSKINSLSQEEFVRRNQKVSQVYSRLVHFD